MTLSGRFVTAAILVMEIEEVFEERIASFDVQRRAFRRSASLYRNFRLPLDNNEQSFRSSRLVVVLMRPNRSFLLLRHRFPFSQTIQAFADVLNSLFDDSALTSHITTSNPRPRSLCDPVSHCSGADDANDLTHNLMYIRNAPKK